MNTTSRQEIISKNNCILRFLDELVFKQDVDTKWIINVINCLMLESPHTSDDD